MRRNPDQVSYAGALEADLRRKIRGEVRFDSGSRALYATDASNYRQVPIGVVLPFDADDIIETIEAARDHGAPILGRGGGTSLAGQCCNVAVVLDMSKYMHRILDLDPAGKTARVQPGLVLDDLRDAAYKHGLTFAPDPATHNHCTLGGVIGNNSCGVHSLMDGRTLENVESLDILTYDGLRMNVGATSETELHAIINEGGRRGEIHSGLKRIRDKYADRIRARYPDIPRRVSGYSLGWIHRWAQLASHSPRLLNFLGRTRPFSSVAKLFSGMALARAFPEFAAKTFTSIRSNRTTTDGDVILWPDTFNNHFHPEVLHAAFNSLRRLGYRVQIPRRSLCCGRPLYDFGFLGRAKDLLREILGVLRDDIRAGKPVVVLEPSCASVFRDEMINLFPQNSDAIRLSNQTFLLSEFLAKKEPSVALPQLPLRALVHGHCHHKSIFGMDDEKKLFERIGFDAEIVDAGCCGMAGAFGFEADHYDVSLKAGDRVLLPRVREAEAATLIVTDGFSCREQIAQCTNRRARHVAEVLDLAFKAAANERRTLRAA